MAKSGEIFDMSVGYQDYCDPNFFARLEPRLVAAARTAAQRGISYRNFRVGACAAVLLPQWGEVVFLDDANNSPYRGAPKDCAEMGIVRKADELAAERQTRADGVRILDMYVAGPSDPELILEVNGMQTPTLHSCFDCQDLMRDHPAVSDSTRIVTLALEGDHVPPERHSVAGLLALYEGVRRPKVSAQLVAEAAALGSRALGMGV